MVVREAVLRHGTRSLAIWCAPSGRGEERRGELDGRGRDELNFLPEEAEARAVLPLMTGHTDAER